MLKINLGDNQLCLLLKPSPWTLGTWNFDVGIEIWPVKQFEGIKYSIWAIIGIVYL